MNEILVLEEDLKNHFWQMTLDRIRLQKAVQLLEARLKEQESKEKKVAKDGESLS